MGLGSSGWVGLERLEEIVMEDMRCGDMSCGDIVSRGTLCGEGTHILRAHDLRRQGGC